MSKSNVLAPQLITGAEMIYMVWAPETPELAKELLPEGLIAAEDTTIYLNQYVVYDRFQHSNAMNEDGFGEYSLTYLGIELKGLDLLDGTPGRYWTHYYNSSTNMRNYAADRGIPATSGETFIEVEGENVYATTVVDGKDAIRTHSKINPSAYVKANGQLKYITKVGGQLMSGRYPYVADMVSDYRVISIDFLNVEPSLEALKPKSPLDVRSGFYSPDISFVYPGGEQPLAEE